MICKQCKCRLEPDEEADIKALGMPEWCTECTETWANSALEEPAKTEWEQ